MRRPKYDKEDDDHHQEDDDQRMILFILPAFVSASGYSCAREWCEDRMNHECGCPRCLRKLGLVVIFHANDWNDVGDMQGHWRKRIVSVKSASYASHLICPGYEGD